MTTTDTSPGAATAAPGGTDETKAAGLFVAAGTLFFGVAGMLFAALAVGTDWAINGRDGARGADRRARRAGRDARYRRQLDADRDAYHQWREARRAWWQNPGAGPAPQRPKRRARAAGQRVYIAGSTARRGIGRFFSAIGEGLQGLVAGFVGARQAFADSGRPDDAAGWRPSPQTIPCHLRKPAEMHIWDETSRRELPDGTIEVRVRCLDCPEVDAYTPTPPDEEPEDETPDPNSNRSPDPEPTAEQTPDPDGNDDPDPEPTAENTPDPEHEEERATGPQEDPNAAPANGAASPATGGATGGPSHLDTMIADTVEGSAIADKMAGVADALMTVGVTSRETAARILRNRPNPGPTVTALIEQLVALADNCLALAGSVAVDAVTAGEMFADARAALHPIASAQADITGTGAATELVTAATNH